MMVIVGDKGIKKGRTIVNRILTGHGTETTDGNITGLRERDVVAAGIPEVIPQAAEAQGPHTGGSVKTAEDLQTKDVDIVMTIVIKEITMIVDDNKDGSKINSN